MIKKLQSIDVSHPMHTPAGGVLRKLHYSDFLDSVLTRSEFSGYPNNGGDHTLRLNLKDSDVAAFLELVRGRFSTLGQGVEDFIQHAQAQVALRAQAFQ